MDTAQTKFEALLAKAPDSALLTNEYINLLASKGDFQDVVDYYDATWRDLRDFEKKTFNPYSEVPPSYASLALSFQKSGRDALAKDTLARMRTSIDIDKAGGAKNYNIAEEAQWLVLTGDHDGAVAALEARFETDTIIPDYMLSLWPVIDLIRDHPGFIDLHARNTARINEERAIAGLAPIE